MNFWSPTELVLVPDPMLDRIKSALGDGASVSAQANAGAHFSQRLQLYGYPQKVGEVDAIVLRLESPTYDLQPQEFRAPWAHLPITSKCGRLTTLLLLIACCPVGNTVPCSGRTPGWFYVVAPFIRQPYWSFGRSWMHCALRGR